MPRAVGKTTPRFDVMVNGRCPPRFGERQRYRSRNAVLGMPGQREARRRYNQRFTNYWYVPAYYEISSRFQLETFCRFDAATMSSDRAILLISDRPDRSQELAHRLGGLCTCRTTGLYERESTAELVTAVVTDVGFRHHSDIERLHHLLSKPRALAAPIVAILRDNSYLQRVQAAAVGATFLFPANVSVSDISSALAPVIRRRFLGSRRPQAWRQHKISSRPDSILEPSSILPRAAKV